MMSLIACVLAVLYSAVMVQAAERLVTLPDFSDGGLVTGARTIRIYLPEGYDRTRERYRVIYFHDGANVFNSASPTPNNNYCSRADVAYDQLISLNRIHPAILVAVDAGPNDGRMQELAPTRDSGWKTGGMTDAYYQFLVTRVKPYVDARYRTRPDAEYTGIAGVSLGGLTSFYLAYNHPETFGFAGCMSSSLWWDNQRLLKQVQSDSRRRTDVRFWFDCGVGEGEDMWKSSFRVVQALAKKGWREGDDLALYIDYTGQHSHPSWGARTPFMLQFLLGKERPRLAGATIRQINSPSSDPIRLLDIAEAPYATLELQYANGFRLNAASPQYSLEGTAVAAIDSMDFGRLTNKGPGVATLRATLNGKQNTSAIQTVIGYGLEDIPQYDRLTCPDTAASVSDDGRLGDWSGVPFITPEPSAGWRFAVARDAERNLHVIVQVTADKIVVDVKKRPWEQDGVEVRVDARPDPMRCNSKGMGDGRQFLLLAASPVEGTTRPAPGSRLPPGSSLVCSRNSGGYTLEATIPAKWLDKNQQAKWEEFRLNICVNRHAPAGTEIIKQWWQPDWRSPGNKVGAGTFRCAR